MQHSLCVRIMQLSSVGMLPDNVTYSVGIVNMLCSQASPMRATFHI